MHLGAGAPLSSVVRWDTASSYGVLALFRAAPVC